ncbi:hypothetical protein K438DRAFT_1867303 [Mycena galopus ATCC 62051]|nr:hypothetical protein K438DRAFT_1867303 [Mycena galopus ATCC 62051]
MAVDDESVPLLDPLPGSYSPLTNPPWFGRYSGATLIVPLALLCRVATLLPTTTTFYILQQFICRRYYRIHDPTRVPPDGHMSDAMCALPAIEESYAAFIALVALMDGIGCADLALICSTLVLSWLEIPLFAQANLIAFVANIYMVDLVHEDNRTSALSSLTGWAALESFPKAKRDALRAERQRARAQATPGRWPVLSRLAATGRRNWRLSICAVHMFFAGLGSGYAVASLVTIVTSLYQYKPAETGYMLTALSGASMFVLTFAIPAIVRVLRPLYRRQNSMLSPTNGEVEVVEATDRLDVHLVIGSWVIDASAYLVFGYMRTRATQLAAVILIGFGPGYGPAVRSLVVASVEPLKQGETLGAIEMVWGLGLFMSPLLMGSILSASVPGIVISAAGILLLVRDADRYHKPARV